MKIISLICITLIGISLLLGSVISFSEHRIAWGLFQFIEGVGWLIIFKRFRFQKD